MQIMPIKNSPVFLKNTDFKSILIKVLFPYQETEENFVCSSLLPVMVNSISEHYPTEEELQKERKKRLILGLSCSREVIGTTGFYSFNFSIPDFDAFGEDLLEEQIQLLEEVIYHPYFEKGVFSTKELDREKRILKTGIENSLKNLHSYQNIQFRKHIDTEGVLSRDLVYYPELLISLSEKELTNFYKEVILNNQPAIYIMGNIDPEKITSLCKKYLYKKEPISIDYPAYFNYYLKPRKKTKIINESSTFHDSCLSIAYKVKDMKKDDVIYLTVLKELLTSISSRLLSIRLRDKENLVYSSRVSIYPHYGVLEVTSFIHKDHKDKVLKAVDEVLKELHNEEKITPLLRKIKKNNKLNLLRSLDDKYFIMQDFFMDDLGIEETLEEFYQKVEKVTAKDISSFIDRLKEDTIYFLEEGEHE